jgi:hypothetical protein
MDDSHFGEILHPKKRAFLAAYSQCGMLTKAADIAHCDRDMHYHWLKRDPVYRDAFAHAKEMVADLHEDEATRRALGWMETRYDSNGNAYDTHKHSDTMLIVRLKALKPDAYRENVRIESTVTVKLEDSLTAGMKRLETLRLAHGEYQQLT